MKALRVTAVGASTVGAIALFLVVAHPARLASALGSLPVSSLATAAGATMAGVMLGASRWRGLLAARGTTASTPRLFAALTAGAAVNNLVPARGGDAVRVESAHRLTGAGRLEIAGTMVAERILDGFVLALLVASGALLSGTGGRFVWIGGGLAAAIVVAALVFVRDRIRGVIGVPLLATGGIWLADVVMYGALARGFHLDLSFGALLLLVGAGNLALAVPGAAAGLGSFELVTLAGAHGIGLGGPQLAAYVLAVHAVIVLPTTVTGLLLAPWAVRPRAFKPRFRARA
jgi:uncharacterized membrane protein YbhN (UPF0104 family)